MDKSLDNAAKIFCGQICNRKVHQLTFRHVERNHKKVYEEIWDFPAVAVACKSHLQKRIYLDYSKGCRAAGFRPPLRQLLETLGIIGKTRKGCKNIIGRCAEQHVCNKLLGNDPLACIKNVEFSTAYRPKTLQVMDYCENCKEIFTQLR